MRAFRLLLLGASLLLPVAVAPSPAMAQATVYCANCATMWTQLLQQGDQARSLATQIQQRTTQLQQYANQVRQGLALPQHVWGQAQADIARVRDLSNASQLLSGHSGDVLTRLNSASGYVDRIGGLTRMTEQYGGWQRSYANSAGQFARTLGLQQGQQADNAALLARLQQSSQSAEGQMQAIQAGNQLAAASMGQLMQVQATISASTQYAMQRDLVAADRSALNDAAMQRFLGGPTPPLTGYQTW